MDSFLERWVQEAVRERNGSPDKRYSHDERVRQENSPGAKASLPLAHEFITKPEVPSQEAPDCRYAWGKDSSQRES